MSKKQFTPEETYAFGRYPLMLLVAYSTMKEFPEAVEGKPFDGSEEAYRTLAVAIATAYAMRKQSWVSRYSGTADLQRRQTWYEVEEKIQKEHGHPADFAVKCLGETFYLKKTDSGFTVIGWSASRKWRPVNGSKFDSLVRTLERLEIPFETLTKVMQKELRQLFKKSPASSQTYFKVWKQVRDKWRTWEWIKDHITV